VDDGDLVHRIASRLGLEDEAASRLAKAALRALGETLSSNLARHVAAGAPPLAGAALRAASRHDVRRDEQALARAAARRAGIPVGRAREVISVVCEVLGSTFDAETFALAQRELPAWLAAAFEPPRRGHRERTAAPSARATLSSGHPGAKRPLASSAPEDPREHRNRLSTARGSRQESAGETLVTTRRR
jgi:uncharacterized protein (DUF2267 family)